LEPFQETGERKLELKLVFAALFTQEMSVDGVESLHLLKVSNPFRIASARVRTRQQIHFDVVSMLKEH